MTKILDLTQLLSDLEAVQVELENGDTEHAAEMLDAIADELTIAANKQEEKQ